jgi:hypothetical protein
VVFHPLPLLQAFPLLIVGRVHHSCLLWPACLFTAHMGIWSSPSPVEFSSLHHFYKLSRSWLLGVCCCSCLLQLACFEGFPLPVFGTQGTPPSLLHVFFVVIPYSSVFFFFPGWGSFCPGGYADLDLGCLWEYHVLLSSPCGLSLPNPFGHCHLAAAWEPSWFLHLM